MKVLAWNCKGLNSENKVFALQRLIQQHNPDIIFLSETRIDDYQYMNSLRYRLGYLNCECIWSHGERGQSGGLALFWRQGIGVDLLDKETHFIDVIVRPENHDSQPWRLTGFYGHPATHERGRVFEKLQRLADQGQFPWAVIGDFNELLDRDEKKGGRNRSEAQMQIFRDTLTYCDLKDLGFDKGERMTFWGAGTEERLDRAVTNVYWNNLFPRASLDHLSPIGGDHTPILLHVLASLPQARKGKPRFRFESFWTDYDECEQVIKNSWHCGADGYDQWVTTQKIKSTRVALMAWKKSFFGNRNKEIEDTRNRLAVLINGANSAATEERKAVSIQLDRLLSDEAKYWKQRSKVTWLKDGDTNSSYFFRKASNHKAKNHIRGLYDQHNQLQETQAGMSKVVFEHFKSMFTAGNIHIDHINKVVDLLQPRVTEDMNNFLCQPYSEEEVKDALFDMYPTKSPGPDGMPPLYFQHYWETTGKDVVKAAQEFLHSGSLLTKINFTHICLIPKIHLPDKVTDLRPIALCNVIYKVSAKALTNRLKKIMPKIISPNQGAFVPGRIITDNILVSNEICHFIHTKRSGRGYMAVKLDMSKAYDRMEWNYLRAVMLKLGFAEHFVEVIMATVTTVTYSFLVNGSLSKVVTPSRGLRQGDPLSPYLFLLCAEGFTALLENSVRNRALKGIRICEGAPVVHHLLFADDSLLFGAATTEECNALRGVLEDYEAASGQQINLSKSEIVFSKSVSEPDQVRLAGILGMSVVDKLEKYLGLPTYIGRKKCETFAYLKERLNNKLLGWQGKLLSAAGKELLIKVVAQTLPSYAMNLFLLPKTFCEELEQKMAKFWWGSTEDNPRRHWMDWEKMCVPKEEGGLGFRDLHMHNIALLGKQVWRLCKNTNSLAFRLLKAKYFPHGSIFGAALSDTPSDVWRSLRSLVS